MTLPSSGQISLLDIDGEFGIGTDLGSYRGVTWYTDAGGSGTFTNTNLGMDQFYSKRATPPTPPISIAYVYNTYSTANSLSYTFSGVSFGSASGTRLVSIAVFANNSGSNPSAVTSATIAGISATIDVDQQIFGDGRPRIAIISAAVPGGTTSGTVTVNYTYGCGGCGIGVYNIPEATAVDATAWSGIGADVSTLTAAIGSFGSTYPRAVVGLAGMLDGVIGDISFSGTFTGRDFLNNWGAEATFAAKGGLVTSPADVTASFGVVANWARVVAVAYR